MRLTKYLVFTFLIIIGSLPAHPAVHCTWVVASEACYNETKQKSTPATNYISVNNFGDCPEDELKKHIHVITDLNACEQDTCTNPKIMRKHNIPAKRLYITGCYPISRLNIT